MIRKGIKEATPVMLGYFPIAMAFGILAKGAGVNIVDGALMSTMVYAGASQFMAVSMIAGGIGPMSIILATFLMNFRHFIMSASVRAKLNTVHSKWYPVIGFFLTDESFSIVSVKENIDDAKYLISLEVSSYLSWGSGTVAGYILGAYFPEKLIQAMGIALYALFVALLVPTCKKSKSALALAILSGGLNTGLIKILNMQGSASFAVSVITVAAIATFVETAYLRRKAVNNEL